MKDYNRNITMYCSVCGNNQFSTLDENISDLLNAPDTTEIKCSNCGKVFAKSELIEANQEIINANIEEVETEIIKDFEKKLAKIFK